MTPFVTFVIPTYERTQLLRSLLYGLCGQADCGGHGNDGWKAIVVFDGENIDEELKLQNEFAEHPVTVTHTDKRYNDFGHTPRNFGLSLVDTEYVVLTGEDNYYAPVYVDAMSVYKSDNPDAIICGVVHSNFMYSPNPYPLALQKFCCDIGQVMLKTELCRGVNGIPSHDACADGDMFDNLMARYGETIRVKTVREILYVHN